eukprot:gene12007-13921_t
MSDQFDTDGAQVDIETATEIHNQTSGEAGSPKSDRTNSPDLSKVLPKLQKRISANSNNTSQNVDSASSQNRNTTKRPSEDGEAPLDFNDIVLEKVAPEVHIPRERSQSITQQRQQQRASVTNSAHNSLNGNVTVLVRNSLLNTVENPEIEKLRTQDINPDENSAAYLALSAAAASAKHGAGSDSEGEATAQAKRRRSVSRQLSGRYQRTTNRKVEGREIQQDHNQYALTYALMLGIRVMTGRRDLEMDRREIIHQEKISKKEKASAKPKSSEDPPMTSQSAPHLTTHTEKEKEKGKDSSNNSSGSNSAQEKASGDSGAPRTTPPVTDDKGFNRASMGNTSSNNMLSASMFNLMGSVSSPDLMHKSPSGEHIHSQKIWDTEAAQQMLVERELTIQDFEDSLELKFRPQGSAGPPVPTPPHKLTFAFKFKDYTPAVFRAVRALSNIDEADYMLSLAGDFNYIEFIANSKSGQFFFYSHDGCYMIKTQTKEECVLLRNIMPKYVEHLSQHPDSLLVRFYGMHRVKFRTSKIYFVIMSSVFNTEKHIDIKYDLKGSLAGRRTSEAACKQGAVQKDLNLMESGRKIRLGEENIDLFYETLKADVNLLQSLNIMDYSLLVGIHDKKSPANSGGAGHGSVQRRASGVVLSQQGAAASLAKQHGGGTSTTTAPATTAPTESISPFSNTSTTNATTNSNNNTTNPSDMNSGNVSVVSANADGSTLDGTDMPIPEVGTVFQSYYGGIPAARGTDEIYFMGIIDILQLYNLGKRTETFYKGLFADKKIQSSIRPNKYSKRMLEFILKHTDYYEIMAQREAQRVEREMPPRTDDSNSSAKMANRKELL